jgi:hypothetical protein
MKIIDPRDLLPLIRTFETVEHDPNVAAAGVRAAMGLGLPCHRTGHGIVVRGSESQLKVWAQHTIHIAGNSGAFEVSDELRALAMGQLRFARLPKLPRE